MNCCICGLQATIVIQGLDPDGRPLHTLYCSNHQVEASRTNNLRIAQAKARLAFAADLEAWYAMPMQETP